MAKSVLRALFLLPLTVHRSLKVFENWIQKYGKVFGYYQGEIPFIVLTDVDMIRDCFIKETNTFHDRPTLVLNVEPYISSLLGVEGKAVLDIIVSRGNTCVSIALQLSSFYGLIFRNAGIKPTFKKKKVPRFIRQKDGLDTHRNTFSGQGTALMQS